MTGFGPYANAKVPDRKYLWTVVVLFALLGLVGLGVLLYQPLRLRYVIHRVQSAKSLDGFDSEFSYLEMVETCVAAARGGNRLAMDAVTDSSAFGNAALGDGLSDVAYRVVASQPQAFFEVLDRRPDEKVIRVLGDITDACLSEDQKELYMIEEPSVNKLAQELRKLTNSGNPEVRKVAQAALDFTRRRFARELAEAEKAEGAKP